MAGNPSPPDYDLADRIALTEPSQVQAISHPLRTTILGLLHERAATVGELAVALERHKSTVAHHVRVLKAAGLVQVVRTRRVRAIEERFYGRTARMFYVGVERSRTTTGCLGISTTSRSPLASRPRPTGMGSYGASSGTPASRRRRQRTSGSAWRSWWRSSISSRGRVRLCTDSPLASIPRTIRPYRAAATKDAVGWRLGPRLCPDPTNMLVGWGSPQCLLSCVKAAMA